MASYLLGEYLSLYIRKKMCNKDYIGCYKDQKAYSYWDSGLLALFTYIKHVLKKSCAFILFS